ncbi:MAG: GAF domain-containing protein [Stenomitos rutilans HA7619-LM2]|nr:GAF domain-containing protein [Stenomitos rutilans HA7619-LM2]
MPEPTSGFLNSTRLLFELQQGNEIARSLSGCLKPEAIAHRVTEGMVAEFGCAFARIWLVEPDRTTLKLVASSGMYTRIDGSFASVPMGAFKVGKIAQNGIPFLSNALADEAWVRDREWAIANGIRGFAGYPLTAGGDVVGVLAVFSRQPMAPEFLEVLQSLCATVTIALEIALQHQQEKQAWLQEKQAWQASPQLNSANRSPLSEQLASILANVRPTLVGTEVPLSAPLTYLFLRAAEILRDMQCLYCRLTYDTASISLEAMTSSWIPQASETNHLSISPFSELLFAVSCLGGRLQIYMGGDRRAVQVLLAVPYPGCVLGPRLHVRCAYPVLQMAFTHLAYLAGLTLCETADDMTVPILTDTLTPTERLSPLLWIETQTQPVPKQARAKLNLTIAPVQLRAAVEAVTQGETWGFDQKPETDTKQLSEREQEIMALLAQGLRDRDIAMTLHISDRTVKFHINNILAKLNAKTRFQALYQVTRNGWIHSSG